MGDPEQLPATVLSKKAQDIGCNQSLFERVYQCFKFENINPIKMLSIQYRMHPEICSFPSKQFYRGKLTTDPWEPLIQMINFFSNSLSFIYRKAIERRSKFLFKPYLVFNLSYSQEVDSDNEGWVLVKNVTAIHRFLL